MREVVLTVRFLCELAMLAALAYAGFELGDGGWGPVVGLGLPVAAIAVWGAFVAPKARRPVPTVARLLIEVTLFGAAAVGLVLADQTALGVALAVAAGVTSALNAYWD